MIPGIEWWLPEKRRKKKYEEETKTQRQSHNKDIMNMQNVFVRR